MHKCIIAYITWFRSSNIVSFFKLDTDFKFRLFTKLMFLTIRSWSTLKQKRLKCKIWEWGLQTRCSLVDNADDEVEDDVLLRNLNTENLIMTVSCFILTPANPPNPIQSTFIALDCVQGAARGGARASLPFLHFGEHQWFITLDPYPNIIIPTPYPLLSICLTNPNRELSHSGKEATDPGLLQEHWLLKHLRFSLIPHSNASQPPEQWPPIHKAFMPKTFSVFLRFT